MTQPPETPRERPVQVLLARTADDDERKRLAEYLEPLANVNRIEEVVALAKSDDIDTARRACFVLGQIGDRRSAVPHLSRLLATASRADVREAAAAALAYLGGARAREALVRALREDPDEDVRARAAHSLGHVGAAGALVDILENEAQPWRVLDEAAESLAFVGGRDAIPVLVKALEHPVPEVRFSAAYALGVIGDPNAIPALERVARADRGQTESGSVARQANEALESIRRAGSEEMPPRRS